MQYAIINAFSFPKDSNMLLMGIIFSVMYIYLKFCFLFRELYEKNLHISRKSGEEVTAYQHLADFL